MRALVCGALMLAGMWKYFNSIHDDATWRGWFGRWHAGESSAALRLEAGVSKDEWNKQSARLGMRIRDLPPGHPGRRRTPVHHQRPDDFRYHNSRLNEGQWRELFRLRVEGVPDTVLAARYGVHPTTICSAAEVRGIRKKDLRREVEGSIAAAGAEGAAGVGTPRWEGEGDPLGGVVIDAGDPERTRRSFEIAIAAAGARADFAAVALRSEALTRLERALFSPGGYRPSAYLSPQTPIPPGGYRPSGYLSPQTPMLPGAGSSGGAGADEGAEAGPPLILRPSQRPPEGDWSTWLFLGGRGAGKTLAGASWIADQAETVGRLALVGPTLHDAREVMIGGPSGVMALPRWRAMGAWPVYEPSRRRLRFPNGAEAWVFSAEDPDSLRGPQFGAAWADEFCAWRGGGETLSLLRMGLRLRGGGGANARLAEPRCLSANEDRAQAASDRVVSGSPPRLMITTTPRPTRALRGLMEEASCVVSRAATGENAENLAPGFVEGLEALYGGTRRAAQELEGRIVEVEGALFTSGMMTQARTDEVFHPWGGLGVRSEGGGVFERVVVGLDPTTTATGDACGIVVVGRRLRADGVTEAVVLADRSARGLSPEGWARRARAAAEAWGASSIVAEVNQGGEMVRAVFKAVGCDTPVIDVRAAVGKRARAEPVAALYEQGRVSHAGAFDDLEEELTAIGGDEDGARGGVMSLDRADALVWAVTALLVKEPVRPRIRML